MPVKDYYKILGVNRSATFEDIKKSYHNMIRKYHPDINQGDPYCEFIFREIIEAYSILGDIDKRLQYSILLNQDNITKKLMHKKFDIRNMLGKKKKTDESYTSILAKQNPSIIKKIKKQK